MDLNVVQSLVRIFHNAGSGWEKHSCLEAASRQGCTFGSSRSLVHAKCVGCWVRIEKQAQSRVAIDSTRRRRLRPNLVARKPPRLPLPFTTPAWQPGSLLNVQRLVFSRPNNSLSFPRSKGNIPGMLVGRSVARSLTRSPIAMFSIGAIQCIDLC